MYSADVEELQGADRRAEYPLALALAIKGNVIFSIESITDDGYIISDFPTGEIPLYLWMGHVWYYPRFHKTYNSLNESELAEVRKLADVIKENLQKAVIKISKQVK